MRAWIVLLILLAGCSGSPTRPTPVPAPTPQPAPRLTVSGAITDTVTGRSVGSFSQEVDRLPALLPVSTGGYVTRQAWVTSGSPTVDLIPEAGFDLTFYRQLVRNGYEAPDSLERLRRLTTAPSIYFQTAGLSPELVRRLESAARQAVWDMSGRTMGVVRFETGSELRADQTGWITVELINEPSATNCGRALLGAAAGHIWLNIAPTCEYEGFAVHPSAIGHEIGHAMGFWHVQDPTALMAQTWVTGRWDPTPKERHHAAIAYSRAPGSRDIDTDPQGSASLLPRVVLD